MSTLLKTIPVSGKAGLIKTLALPVCKPMPLKDMGILLFFDLDKTR